jgi:hypothetical protein
MMVCEVKIGKSDELQVRRIEWVDNRGLVDVTRAKLLVSDILIKDDDSCGCCLGEGSPG